MIDLKKIYASKQFISAHPSAKSMLKIELDALNSKNALENTDIVSIYLLIDDLNLYYSLTDEIGSNYTVVNAKGLTISNPLLKEKSSAEKSAIKLLTEMGGTLKSKRTCNRKEMAEADTTALDTFFADETMKSDESSDF